MIWLQLFYVYLKIGIFGFGGGYAMLSLIQADVVERYGWISSQEFTDIVAISQMTPGPIGINAATYVGYTAIDNAGYSLLMAVIGSLLASFAVMLPSFVLMLVVSRFFMKYSKHTSVERVFAVLRPVVVGLIASAALLLMSRENFGLPQESPLQFIVSVALFLFSFVAVKRFRISPILVLVISGAFGAFFYAIF